MGKPYLRHTLKEGDHKVRHKGNPPHAGWWLTYPSETAEARHCAWRWWDGKVWSLGVRLVEFRFFQPMSSQVEGLLGTRANLSGAYDVTALRWSYEWPAKARVARVNPDTGEVTGAGPNPYVPAK